MSTEGTCVPSLKFEWLKKSNNLFFPPPIHFFFFNKLHQTVVFCRNIKSAHQVFTKSPNFIIITIRRRKNMSYKNDESLLKNEQSLTKNELKLKWLMSSHSLVTHVQHSIHVSFGVYNLAFSIYEGKKEIQKKTLVITVPFDRCPCLAKRGQRWPCSLPGASAGLAAGTRKRPPGPGLYWTGEERTVNN